MLAIWVKVRIKPEKRQRFLDAIEVDALGSEKDERGCFRFNVLQDEQDENVYYFYEVYTGEEALEAHRATRTTRSGARPPTPWTVPPRRFGVDPCFRPPRATGERPGHGHEC